MIRFVKVEKRYPAQAQPVVAGLDLEVPSGSICVLIGPSGCGKTTMLRMINRLIEPTSGTITVMGKDITTMDAVELRRGIGYVIQNIGLFPHMTLYENIATVPRLLKWDEARIARRVDELIGLVGMDPSVYRHRYPRQLSGGQRQRIGVARALATDPPVMLMDEPFGAIDPINREHLQNEFLKIQRQIRKTVIFVTHDIDEAIKMGDYICILKDGHVRQFGSPEEILTHPADSFVASFLGTGRTFKRLDLIRVHSVLEPVPEVTPSLTISADAALKEALSVMLSEDVEELLAVDDSGKPMGTITMETIRRVARRSTSEQEIPEGVVSTCN